MKTRTDYNVSHDWERLLRQSLLMLTFWRKRDNGRRAPELYRVLDQKSCAWKAIEDLFGNPARRTAAIMWHSILSSGYCQPDGRWAGAGGQMRTLTGWIPLRAGWQGSVIPGQRKTYRVFWKPAGKYRKVCCQHTRLCGNYGWRWDCHGSMKTSPLRNFLKSRDITTDSSCGEMRRELRKADALVLTIARSFIGITEGTMEVGVKTNLFK